MKMTSLEDEHKSVDANSASMTSTAEPELGTAQPQLVSPFNIILRRFNPQMMFVCLSSPKSLMFYWLTFILILKRTH